MKTPEHIRQKNKEWYYNNLDKVRAYTKKYNEENREERRRKGKIDGKKYREKYREKNRLRNAAYWKALREKTMTALGGAVCVKCGFSDYRALHIDHKNGGGHKHVKSFTSNKAYLAYVLEHPDKFQVLCANDNSIKRYENNEMFTGKRQQGDVG
jgi:hypothetical protein